MNKQKGDMYGFVNYTWNAIKGKCPHGCDYCYMKPFWRGELHLDEKELKQDLGEDNFIFVGSSTDMFAENIPEEWIRKVLDKTLEHDNEYLFQTKNPKRFDDFNKYYPRKIIFGITLETNRENNLNNCPPRRERVAWMNTQFMKTERKMITIEPIMDFDLDELVKYIKVVNPEFVNIGADSKGHKLPEPSSEKIGVLIKELEKFTEVNLKPNLKRLYSF